jgi:hypothetical protein
MPSIALILLGSRHGHALCYERRSGQINRNNTGKGGRPEAWAPQNRMTRTTTEIWYGWSSSS